MIGRLLWVRKWSNDFGSFSFFGQNHNLMDADFTQIRTNVFLSQFEQFWQPKLHESLNDFARADFTSPRDIQASVRWIHNPSVIVHSTSPASSTDRTGTHRTQQNFRWPLKSRSVRLRSLVHLRPLRPSQHARIRKYAYSGCLVTDSEGRCSVESIPFREHTSSHLNLVRILNNMIVVAADAGNAIVWDLAVI